MDPKLITPLLIGALLVWTIYRRARRTFGRQAVNVGRLRFRVGILSVIGAVLLFALGRNLAALGALAAGLGAGATLGYVGLRYTKFEVTPQGSFYTPHAYIGALITAVFLARILYRYLIVRPGTQVPQDPLAGYRNSPLTLAIFGLLIGYYVLFNLGVLRKTQHEGTSTGDSAL